MRGYYKLQIKNDSTKVNHVDEVIADRRITSHIDYAGVGFEKLNKGDLVLVHKGSYPHSLVEVLHKITNEKEIKGTSFGIDYRVDVKSIFSELDSNLNFKKQNKQIGYDGTFIPLYDNTSKTFLFMQSWYNYIKKENEMADLKNLLFYKKQIILQGPPGTGKTRLAKEIAKELIGAKKNITPLGYVENFIRSFKENEQSLKIDLLSNHLIYEFKESFPLEKIKNLSIDEYTLGNGSQDSFCYWMEQKLAPTCKFSPGGAGTTVYGISYNKENGTLRVNNEHNPDDFMSEIRIMLSTLVENEDYTKARKMKFWYSFILKILHSYNPEKYFPVLSKDHLKLFAKIFEIDSKGLDDIILNKKINSAFTSLKDQFKSSISSIVLMRHLYDKFKIKDGVLIESIEMEDGINISGNYKIIQFHPSYTYEDFVRGISAESNTNNQIEFKAKDKLLSEMAKEALLNKDEKYVLIIDEINRANLSSVLGELIYSLEYRYFFNDSNEKQHEAEVESLYGIKNETASEDNRILRLPENLYIIGTMNTADRSVGHIDYAIRRRFAFVDVLPQKLKNSDEIIFNENLFKSVSELFVKDFNIETEYNSESIINNETYLSNEFSAKDVWLGHSYFIQKIKKDNQGNITEKIPADMNVRLDYEIKPILMEYVRDGVLKSSAVEVIKKLSV
jgi:MoxR-like ATPase